MLRRQSMGNYTLERFIPIAALIGLNRGRRHTTPPPFSMASCACVAARDLADRFATLPAFMLESFMEQPRLHRNS
jgi:hypothetical protein